MDMGNFINRSYFLLIFGFLVLLCAIGVSIFSVFDLEKAFEKKRIGVNAQDSYDNLLKKVKDWQIVTNVKLLESDKQKQSVRSTVKEALLKSIQDVDKAVQGKHPQQELFLTIKQNLINLTDPAGISSALIIKKMETVLNQINQLELEGINKNAQEVVGSTNRQLIISIGSFILAIFLILVSFLMRYKQERMRLETIQELVRLKEAAETASLMKSKFLSTVSHEIRTPLNGIIGLSDVLSSSSQTVKEQSLARMINQSGKVLLRIISDILDFSKIEAGKIELSMADFSIFEVANQVLFTLSAKAAKKSINLNYDIDPSIPKTVRGDPDRISQVLYNLVGNAIKFTAIGSVILRIKRQTLQNNMIHIYFSVDDTGIGVDKKDLSHLFIPFSQIHKGGTTGEPGTGLGLSISQSIVETMGGKIEIYSSVGHGSQFYFTIPFKEFSEECLGNHSLFKICEFDSDQKIDVVSGLGYRPKILIVEDNPTNQVVAQTMLQILNADYLTASDGREAIELVEKNSFDLVLMDCQMPILDGIETTKILRNKKYNFPIIAMTANAYEKDEIRCKEAGMNNVLTKPISITHLYDQIVKNLPGESGSDFSRSHLANLDKSISIEGRKKVVGAFLSTTEDFRKNLKKFLDENDIISLNQLGHRFKTSSLTVGGVHLSHMCASIEQAEFCEEIKSLEDDILSSIHHLEQTLVEFS